MNIDPSRFYNQPGSGGFYANPSVYKTTEEKPTRPEPSDEEEYGRKKAYKNCASSFHKAWKDIFDKNDRSLNYGQKRGNIQYDSQLRRCFDRCRAERLDGGGIDLLDECIEYDRDGKAVGATPVGATRGRDRGYLTDVCEKFYAGFGDRDGVGSKTLGWVNLMINNDEKLKEAGGLWVAPSNCPDSTPMSCSQGCLAAFGSVNYEYQAAVANYGFDFEARVPEVKEKITEVSQCPNRVASTPIGETMFGAPKFRYELYGYADRWFFTAPGFVYYPVTNDIRLGREKFIQTSDPYAPVTGACDEEKGFEDAKLGCQFFVEDQYTTIPMVVSVSHLQNIFSFPEPDIISANNLEDYNREIEYRNTFIDPLKTVIACQSYDPDNSMDSTYKNILSPGKEASFEQWLDTGANDIEGWFKLMTNHNLSNTYDDDPMVAQTIQAQVFSQLNDNDDGKSAGAQTNPTLSVHCTTITRVKLVRSIQTLQRLKKISGKIIKIGAHLGVVLLES